MDLKLHNKKVLVLGASQGLGLAIAESFVKEGAIVSICSRSEENLLKAQKAIGAKHTIAFDLMKPLAGEHVVKAAIQKMGGIDVLVTNTGGPPKGSILDISSEMWLQGFQGLWLSAVDAIRTAIPEMRKNNWGRIMLVTSAAAKEPMNGLTVSNGLRAGLSGLTKSISNEVAGWGITINALLPGYTDTERLQELKIPKDKITAQIPAGRLGKPEELAALTTFLGSEQAAYITGQAIACDGGYLKGI